MKLTLVVSAAIIVAAVGFVVVFPSQFDFAAAAIIAAVIGAIGRYRRVRRGNSV